jgi:hypothetical protein
LVEIFIQYRSQNSKKMKKSSYQKILPVFLLCIWFPATTFAQELDPAQWPSLAGYWKFQDTSNLTQATVGNDLILAGTHEWAPGAYWGDTAVSIAIGSYYKCYHQIPPNGGGDSVNRYALMFDFMVHNFDSWHTFHQTDSTNANDGECFIKPQFPGVKSTIGTATTGYTPDSISPGVWYRMVISVCLDSFYRYYIDGDLWLDGNLQVADGRFAMTPLLLFFADNNQEDDTIQIGSLAIFNNFLTDAEVAMLGTLDPCIANPPLVHLGGDIVICSTDMVTLDAGPGFVSYLWSTGDTTQQITIDTTLWGIGTGQVSVSAVNIHHCIAADTLQITFVDCSPVPENDEKEGFIVSPNPFSDEIVVQMPAGHYRISVINLAGQTVMGPVLMENQLYRLDTGLLSPGMYQVVIEGSGERRVMKMVKSNRW